MPKLPLDQSVYRELQVSLQKNGILPPSLRNRDRRALAQVLGGAAPPGLEAYNEGPRPAAVPAYAEEAIVRLFGRPSMLIQNDRIVPPESEEWQRRLALFRPLVEPALRSVGRVRLLGSDDLSWAGTAWVVARGVAVTNRHVAETFAYLEGGAVRPLLNASGKEVKASLDFGSERSVSAKQVAVKRVLFLAPRGPANPDLAVLELEGAEGIEPIEFGEDVGPGDWVGVVGYPAYDDRNAPDAQARIFSDLYEVKRFAPGQVLAAEGAEPFVLGHDASTLGGNSGSVLLNLRTGQAAGLHFAGRYLESNYAVKASKLNEILTSLKVTLPQRAPAPAEQPFNGEESVEEEAPKGDPTHEAKYFEGRKGYDPGFLGAKHPVAWPEMGDWEQDLAPRLDNPKEHRLDYTHFSVMVSRSRRMPVVTAVNIEGKSSQAITRDKDVWYFDGRIDRRYQIGNAEAYTHNRLDRGHMVRREDPNWGEDAEQANLDTFHYTNAIPQHERLNQRTWLSLEKFILDKARAQQMRATVFTGPVLRKDDFPYREIQVPAECFKVVVVVDQGGKLEATGYLQSQTDYLGDGLDEGVYGGGSTYQVPIAHLEAITGLRFGLGQFDPLSGGEEGPVSGFRGHRVRTAQDIQLK